MDLNATQVCSARRAPPTVAVWSLDRIRPLQPPSVRLHPPLFTRSSSLSCSRWPAECPGPPSLPVSVWRRPAPPVNRYSHFPTRLLLYLPRLPSVWLLGSRHWIYSSRVYSFVCFFFFSCMSWEQLFGWSGCVFVSALAVHSFFF